MDTLPGAPEDAPPYFYIGQHETNRTVPVTNLLVSQAQDVGVGHIPSEYTYRKTDRP